MIEIAAHVPGTRCIAPGVSLSDLAAAAAFPDLDPVRVDLARVLGPRQDAVARIYFGTEFCEHLIPSRADLETALEGAARAGLPLTLLTPFVPDRGLERLRPLLEILVAKTPGAEVVFNDWGTAALLRREMPGLVPVMGRLLAKSLRDPRFTDGLAASGSLTAEADAALRTTGTGSRAMRRLLASFGVRRVELDLVPQGFDLDETDLDVSVYAPFGMISTARVCMSAALGHGPEDRFEPGIPCRRECRDHLTIQRYTRSPFGAPDRTFYHKGNSHFFAHRPEALAALVAELDRRGGRLVCQPGVPLWS